MLWIPQICFIAALIVSVYLFAKNVGKIRRNILLGRDEDRSDRKGDRFKTMLKVAFGQTKMAVRPIPAILHFIVYAGFILINIEVLEIVIDGIFGTHRVLSFLNTLYDVAIAFFEILAILVLLACVLFLSRRFIQRLPRFHKPEMRGWPTRDATIILVAEIILMSALLMMNAADQVLQNLNHGHYFEAGVFPISSFITSVFNGVSIEMMVILERIFWWLHIIGIFMFLNFLPYSKHFHVILAFPNTYYSKLEPQGHFANTASVTNEVKMMLGIPDADANAPPPERFGARDVQDLTWKNLMDAYTCTECGRCTSVCPANLTGKVLSPRKIMMDTRDRLEEVGKGLDAGLKNDDSVDLHSRISKEELWACTSCNACVEACPVNIDPLNIILQMRQYLIMEKSEAPSELNMMFNNIENNGAPWQFPAQDRDAWAQNDKST